MHAEDSRVAAVVVGTVHRCCPAANGHIHNDHVVVAAVVAVGIGYGY